MLFVEYIEHLRCSESEAAHEVRSALYNLNLKKDISSTTIIPYTFSLTKSITDTTNIKYPLPYPAADHCNMLSYVCVHRCAAVEITVLVLEHILLKFRQTFQRPIFRFRWFHDDKRDSSFLWNARPLRSIWKCSSTSHRSGYRSRLCRAIALGKRKSGSGMRAWLRMGKLTRGNSWQSRDAASIRRGWPSI